MFLNNRDLLPMPTQQTPTIYIHQLSPDGLSMLPKDMILVPNPDSSLDFGFDSGANLKPNIDSNVDSSVDSSIGANHHDSVKQIAIHIAALEAQLQPDDAWSVSSIMSVLEASHQHVLIATTSTMQADNTVSEPKTPSHSIIGYCLYQQVLDEAEILRIGTHPNKQRQGSASQLLAALCAQTSIHQLWLEVRADNIAAIGLYQRFGFEKIAERAGYYKSLQPNTPAINAWVMQKTFSSTSTES